MRAIAVKLKHRLAMWVWKGNPWCEFIDKVEAGIEHLDGDGKHDDDFEIVLELKYLPKPNQFLFKVERGMFT